MQGVWFRQAFVRRSSAIGGLLDSRSMERAPHLPCLEVVHLGPLVSVVLVCTLLEVFAGFLMWRASRVTKGEISLLQRRQTLKIGVSKTNYASTFVENSKLKRQLLKVEKQVEQLQARKEKRRSSCGRVVRIAMWCVYGSMALVMWGYPLITFSPDYLWPSVRVHAFSSGGEPGSLGALSVIAMFRFGIAPRFLPTS